EAALVHHAGDVAAEGRGLLPHGRDPGHGAKLVGPEGAEAAQHAGDVRCADGRHGTREHRAPAAVAAAGHLVHGRRGYAGTAAAGSVVASVAAVWRWHLASHAVEWRAAGVEVRGRAEASSAAGPGLAAAELGRQVVDG